MSLINNAPLYQSSLLSPAQCRRLLRDASNLASREGLLFGPLGLGEVNRDRYFAREQFIDLEPRFAWLFECLDRSLAKAAEHFGLPAVRMHEMPRLLRYDIGGHIDWHVDGAPGRAGGRLLTLSLQLSAPSDYSGGDLQVGVGGGVVSVPREQGNVSAFPVHLRHRVTRVEQGRRMALVAWGYV